ncbi:hypothetical protein H0H87_004671 [Tephrocybe sp. NHM501043]|nr:hypothetical protein H0H87_004671 [Tephrocybe sp. NHM501043]
MASDAILNSLADAVTQKPPFCTGTVPTTSRDSKLFYKQGSTTSWLDLSKATEPELEALSRACSSATFGRGNKDVLDESYRKAGKMDLDDFSIMLNVDDLGINNRICAQLLDAGEEDKVIRAEMYKLNVYGKGSFFKSHKDTPRGDSMFGSLVVVFPTPHSGGALVLRHFGQEWTFDSAALTREQGKPSIVYIAFYSDVDHEVTVVESGYRVTLTYNLFFETKGTAIKLPPWVLPVAPDDRILFNALSTALDDPEFLSTGGDLGFGMSFKYPMRTNISDKALRKIEGSLKGSDAVIYRVCRQLNLQPSLNAVYMADTYHVIVNAYKLPDLDGGNGREVINILCEDCDGHVIREVGEEPVSRDIWPVIEMAWVTPLTHYSNFGINYVAYGNDAPDACVYADLCIGVKIGPFGDRATIKEDSDCEDKEGDDDDDEDDDDDDEEEDDDDDDDD